VGVANDEAIKREEESTKWKIEVMGRILKKRVITCPNKYLCIAP
jgi:hypothetical protein